MTFYLNLTQSFYGYLIILSDNILVSVRLTLTCNYNGPSVEHKPRLYNFQIYKNTVHPMKHHEDLTSYSVTLWTILFMV